MSIIFDNGFEVAGKFDKELTFERGVEEHESMTVWWMCRSCRFSETTDNRRTRNKCPKCNRWMEWQPVLYAGEIIQ